MATVVPGGTGKIAGKIGTNTAKKAEKQTISKNKDILDQSLDSFEEVWINGKIKATINTSGIPRFNAQNVNFGEAALHNSDVLQGRKFLTQKENVQQTVKNRRNNTKILKSNYPKEERDEVPPASTFAARDGNSSVRLISRKDNQEHGRALRSFYRTNNIKPGDWFIYE